MTLRLVRPDLYFFEQYNDMMREWLESGTQIAPWFLVKPFDSLDAFAQYIRMLYESEMGLQDSRFCSTSSYFVLDENDRLVGAARLGHYLTVAGLNTYGHIGYGVRPGERNKGYATEVLRMCLAEARERKMHRCLLGAHTSNTASCRVIEKCGGILENIVPDPENADETISRYWIRL